MINLQNLLDDVKCYETVRRLRGPEGSGARTVMRPNGSDQVGIPPSRRGGNTAAKGAITILTI